MHSMQNAYQILLSEDIISKNIKGSSNTLLHAVVLCLHEVVLTVSSHAAL